MSGTTAGIDVTELTQSFKLAKNKREQVQILADLNCRSAFEIAEILEREGAFKGLGMAARQFSNNYRPVAAARPKRRGTPRAVFDEAEALRMWDEKVPLREMAQRLGVAHNTIERWVKRNNLTRDHMHPGRVPQSVRDPIDELRAKELFDEGLDDLAIAEALGCTISRVVEFRRRTRLLRPRGGNKKRTEDKGMEKETQPAADVESEKFEQILESVDAGEKSESPELPAASPTCCQPGRAVDVWDGYTVPEPVRERGAMTVKGFRVALVRLLSEAMDGVSLSINGEPVRDIFGVQIAVRNEQVFVDLRTRETV